MPYQNLLQRLRRKKPLLSDPEQPKKAGEEPKKAVEEQKKK